MTCVQSSNLRKVNMNEEHSHDSLRDIVWDNVPAQETEHVPFRQRNGTVLSSLSQKLHVIESGCA